MIFLIIIIFYSALDFENYRQGTMFIRLSIEVQSAKIVH